jgi:Transglutaminase-like superfamily
VIVQRVPEKSFERFSPLEKVLLIGEIISLYARTKLMLRSRKIDDVADQARAALDPKGETPPPEVLWFALRLGSVVEKSLQHLPGDTRCLTRSLVLVQMLARRGVYSNVVIGVRPAPSFAAHAWVELDGRALLSPIEYGEGRLAEF